MASGLRPRRKHLLVFLALSAGFVPLLAAAPALATDRFVDDSAGVGQDTGDCSSTAPIPANPHVCKTIGYAITQSSSGDVIHLGGGTYNESVTLPAGVSLRQDNFSPPVTSGATIVDGGSNSAVTISSGGAEVRGLTLRGGTPNASGSLTVASPASPTIAANTFDDTAPNPQLLVAGGSPLIIGNTFIGINDGTTRRAINISGAGSPEIASNTMSNFFGGIQSTPPSPSQVTLDVHNNTISGIYDIPPVSIGVAIDLLQGTEGTIADNVLEPAAGQSFAEGIDAFLNQAGLSLNLRRNLITGFPSNGVAVAGGALGLGGPLTLSGDLIAKNFRGLELTSIGGGVQVENATIADNTNHDVLLSNTALSLDSSIVGNPISTVVNASCAISFSRGPTTSGTNCESFQTSADPQFADPAAGDYHLLAGSPMIDAGNPAPPSLATDIDGDPRAVEGNGVCDNRRDIGADEFVPATPFFCPVMAPAPAGRDVTPPQTKIGKHPPRRTKKRTARFTFSSDEQASFQCKLDRKSFKACRSPKTFRGLKLGTHSFRVKATDAAGNTDPSPAVRRWKIVD